VNDGMDMIDRGVNRGMYGVELRENFKKGSKQTGKYTIVLPSFNPY
jgi:hypothetical protein